MICGGKALKKSFFFGIFLFAGGGKAEIYLSFLKYFFWWSVVEKLKKIIFLFSF